MLRHNRNIKFLKPGTVQEESRFGGEYAANPHEELSQISAFGISVGLGAKRGNVGCHT